MLKVPVDQIALCVQSLGQMKSIDTKVSNINLHLRIMIQNQAQNAENDGLRRQARRISAFRLLSSLLMGCLVFKKAVNSIRLLNSKLGTQIDSSVFAEFVAIMQKNFNIDFCQDDSDQLIDEKNLLKVVKSDTGTSIAL